VVVMLAADNEPFADVVVAGPNHVIFIQCKLRYHSNPDATIDWQKELAKVGFCTWEQKIDEAVNVQPQQRATKQKHVNTGVNDPSKNANAQVKQERKTLPDSSQQNFIYSLI